MEQYGNTTTYNVELVLHRNILSSEYWRKTASKLATVEVNKRLKIDLVSRIVVVVCSRSLSLSCSLTSTSCPPKKTNDQNNAHQALIDQIYYDVDHVEPWMAGRSSRGPSSAFCLLHRLGELVPAQRDIRRMLDHRDSAYIRAVAFLYLRYVADPRTLWGWVERYLEDGEDVAPSPSAGGAAAKTVTIGEFVRELLVDPFYFETIFPRIPKPVADDLEGKLRSRGLSTRARGNAGLGGPSRRGGSAAPSSVKSALSVSLARRGPGPAVVSGGGNGSRRRSRSRSPGERRYHRDDDDDRSRDSRDHHRHHHRHRRRYDDRDRYDRRRFDDDDKDYRDDDRYYRRRSRSRSPRGDRRRDDDRYYDRR